MTAEQTGASADTGVASIRHAVALTDNRHVAVASVTGTGAFDLVDRVCARELFVRDNQILQSVFLNPDGTVRADVEICRDDATLHILAEGVSSDELVALLNENRPAGLDAQVVDLSQSRRMLGINGAYAWELLADLAGPEVIGLPYLTFFEGEGWTCFRAGKTGEFGYYLLTEAARYDALRSQILDLGARYDMVEADVAAVDQCQLENGFLCMHAPGITAYNPIELQQQWRVSYRKDYVGAQALLKRRSAGVARRSTHVVSAEPIAAGDDVQYQGASVGTLIHTGYSTIRGDWVGLAMLDLACAHPGLNILRASDTALKTISAPAINNRSLYVNPQNHSYFTRAEESHPPLVMDATWALSLVER